MSDPDYPEQTADTKGGQTTEIRLDPIQFSSVGDILRRYPRDVPGHRERGTMSLD